MKWKAYLDDGSAHVWEEPWTLPDGRSKPLSLSDLDPHAIAQLVTLNSKGEVVHSLVFPVESRANRIPVWRRSTYLKGGQTVLTVALMGYNRLNPDGSESLMLDAVDEDGTLYSAAGIDFTLQPFEVFSDQEKNAIQEAQAAFRSEVAATDPNIMP